MAISSFPVNSLKASSMAFIVVFESTIK
eukprot:Gb_26912 [translate_table: standard]